MKHYELMYIVPLKIGQEENTEIQEKVRQQLIAQGAKITREENWGKRKLAYPIHHVRHGVYVVTEFDLEPSKLGGLQEWLSLSSDILRAQLIAKKVKSPELLAREQALQEKLMKNQLKANETARGEENKVDHEATQPVTAAAELADLDKKLEQILEQEIVK